MILVTIYLPFFTFLTFCVSWSSLRASTIFFVKTSKILMKFNVVFEGLQLQNVFIMFLFSMKHSYLLMVKISPRVNNSFWFLHGMKEQQ